MMGIGLAEAIREARRRRIKIWPVRSNRASALGHPCLKHLVLLRTRWEEMLPHGVDKQGIFDEGNHQERAALRDLDDAGIDVVEQQVSLVIEEYDITGHIDGMVRSPQDGILVPLEIKSTSDYAFGQLAHTPDLYERLMHGRWYWANYPTQLLLYCHMRQKPYGVWLFKNKINGDYQDRIIRLDDHLDHVNRVLEKARQINCHVSMGTMPEGIEDWSVCKECGFVGHCHPDRVVDGQISFMSELEHYLDLRRQIEDRIREPRAQLKMINAELRKMLERKDGMVIAGKWRCVPHKHEMAARRPYTQTRWDYERIEE